MRSLTALLLLSLLFNSCQQRYWQVKKVKSDQNKSPQKEQVQPEKEAETLVSIPTDTLTEVHVDPSEASSGESLVNAEVPETNPLTFSDKSEPLEDLSPQESAKNLLPFMKEPGLPCKYIRQPDWFIPQISIFHAFILIQRPGNMPVRAICN